MCALAPAGVPIRGEPHVAECAALRGLQCSGSHAERLCIHAAQLPMALHSSQRCRCMRADLRGPT